MDVLTSFVALPEPVQIILLNLASRVSGNILSAGGYAIKKAFTAEPKQKALYQAMAQALWVTAWSLTDDLDLAEHYVGLLADWTDRPEVAGELSQVIDPRPETKLDLTLLVDEFEALDYEPELFDEDVAFEEVIARFITAFYEAAAGESELQGAIEIGLLRGIAQRMELQVREGRKQTALMKEMVETGKRAAPQFDLDAFEKAYLCGLYRECNELPLAGKPVDEGGKHPRLQKVYVDLETETELTPALVFERLGIPESQRSRLQRDLVQALGGTEMRLEQAQLGRDQLGEAWLRQALDVGEEQREAIAEVLKEHGVVADAFWAALRPPSALECIQQHRQLVLLGDPGSGKSTLTRRLAGSFAAVAMDELDEQDKNWRSNLQGAFDHRLLPVRVVLSRWAQNIPDGQEGKASHLIDECLLVLQETSKIASERVGDKFMARLTARKPTALLLLDGLDEVADEGQRRTVLAALRDFCEHYQRVPLVVTCRVRPYQEGKAYRLPLPDFTLAPLNGEAIVTFLQRWHDELAWAGIWDGETAEAARQRLLDAIQEEDRTELREMAGTPLLLTMMARVNYKHGLPRSRAMLYERYVQQLLWEWERQRQGGPGKTTSLDKLLQKAEVQQVSLDRELARLAYGIHGQDGSRDTVDISEMDLRKVIERIHHGDAAAKAAWAVEVLQLIDERSGLLHALSQGEIYRFSHRTFQEYLAARWMASGDYLPKFREKIDQEQWREAVMLAIGYQIFVQGEFENVLEVIDELMPEMPSTANDWRQVRLLGDAYYLLGVQRASEAERHKLAQRVMDNTPARLTDLMQNRHLTAKQRLDAGLLLAKLDIAPPGLDDFVPPLAQPSPTWGFHIARYPVTNKQFRCFVDAGGYGAEQWWSEKGWEYRQKNDWTEPRWWDDERLNHSTQPVVGVSWYEANAYCRWLTEELRSTDDAIIDQEQEVRLPTQKEWMQAAGDRTYPWGNDFDPALANTKDSNLGQITPVHMYLDGATPDGVWDLSGNVWEWTGEESYLKGGSWLFDKDRAKSAARNWNNPNDRNYNIGFRVVVVPISRV